MKRSRFRECLGLLLLALFPLACDGGGGGDRYDFSSLTLTTAVAVADLDGDGVDDIAATSLFGNGPPPHAGFATVFLQDPTHPGSFSRREYEVGGDPWFIEIGDLNADGLPDLASANETREGSISILFQRPGAPGSFLSAQNLATASHPNAVAIGRLNADAAMDLAVADLGVSLFLQDPGAPGNFLPRSSLGLGSAAGVAIGDLNADGAADVAVVGGGNVRVLMQDPLAPGTYLPAVVLAAGLQPYDVAIADLNADAAPDLVVANSASNTVSVFLQDATTPGNFLLATHYAVGRSPIRVAIGDLNGDGTPDVAVANMGFQDGVVSVLLQDPSRPGQFLPAANYVAGFQPSSVAIGDLNTDGRLDLAVAVGDGVAILFQNPSQPGTFLHPTLLGIER